MRKKNTCNKENINSTRPHNNSHACVEKPRFATHGKTTGLHHLSLLFSAIPHLPICERTAASLPKQTVQRADWLWPWQDTSFLFLFFELDAKLPGDSLREDVLRFGDGVRSTRVRAARGVETRARLTLGSVAPKASKNARDLLQFCDRVECPKVDKLKTNAHSGSRPLKPKEDATCAVASATSSRLQTRDASRKAS